MTADHALDVRYEWLDHLPSRLFEPVVTHVHGQLGSRGKAIVTLREALLGGRVPPPEALAWPDEPLRSTLVEALIAANVGPYCAGEPETVDDMILFILDTVGNADEFFDRALIALHTLARKDEDEAMCRRACGQGDGDDAGRLARPPRSLEAIDDDVRRDAARMMCELVQARTHETWSELASVVAQLKPIFRALVEAVGLPPGSERGLLRGLPRGDLLEMRRLLAHLPALKELLRVLGRMRETRDPDAGSVLERIGRAVQRTHEREVHSRDGDGADVRGIERSGEIGRMLPSEAVLLTRPVLRMLWRARWAEDALLTYRAQGVFTKRIQETQTFEDGEAQRAPRAERGPVVIVLDTSGSMRGVPETIAKAVVMQIVGMSLPERRAVYVYSFSGPGDVVEHEVSFEADGLAKMLAFVSHSFCGGTSIDEPLRRACDRLESDAYRQADLLLLSDGHFCVDRDVDARIRALRTKSQARIHGVRIGRGGGFEQLECDVVNEVTEWTSIIINN